VVRGGMVVIVVLVPANVVGDSAYDDPSLGALRGCGLVVPGLAPEFLSADRPPPGGG
jgi:hypothetical protein